MSKTALLPASVACVTLVVCTPCAYAEHLPLTTYTTAQGLASNDVTAAVEDSQGFLWLGTSHGLSRFDGKEFRTFGAERGLTDERVTSLVLGARDALWVGTQSGVFRFDPRNGGVFVPIQMEGRRERWVPYVLAVDRDGRLWCGSDGLYRLETTRDGASVLRRLPLPPRVALPLVTALTIDPAGNVWAAREHVYRLGPDGSGREFAGTIPEASFASVDPRGRVWITGLDGLYTVDECDAAAPDACRVRRVLQMKSYPWTGPVWRPDGGYWIGTWAGLLEVDLNNRIVRRISRAEGLAAERAAPILLDRSGDLWISVAVTALQRLAGNGLTAFGRADGVAAGLIDQILTTRAGGLVAIGHRHVLQRLNGNRFEAVRPRMPPGVRDLGWGWNQIDLEDRFGQWWMSTGDGVVRWPAVQVRDLRRTPPIERLVDRGCFGGRSAFRLYEDSHADLWISTLDVARPTLSRWNRATETLECFATRSFLGEETAPTAFLDDRRGALWIGFYRGEIARYRDGRFVCLFDCADRMQGNITSMLLDHRGRLWITTERAGVLRIDDPAADRPSAVRFTRSNGLSSEHACSVLEDRFNRVYIGTDVGVDVLEPDGIVRHYGTEDGLPNLFINSAASGPNGDLWFGTLDGLARLMPRRHIPPSFPASILIDGVRIAGVPRAVRASGEREIEGIVLAPDQRDLQIDLVVLPRETASHALLQHRLADDEPWSPPSSSRSIVLAGLGVGRHRLQIRAVGTSGPGSPPVATLSFEVRAPVYQRGWFLALATLVSIAVISIAYRSRLAHVMALERQRTRIAMDLHDEMGSRLGSIGLLADVAAEQTTSGTPERSRLEQIAETAAEMGASLAEIVWSLRREAMTLESVGQHLAVHGRRLFAGESPTFEAHFPERWPAGEMSLVAGRAVLLVGLEALHNCARHAHATSVRLELGPRGDQWQLLVSDDGSGMAPNGSSQGFGLETMRHRAAAIGAALTVDSRPGHGTSVRLLFDPRASGAAPNQMNIRSTSGRFASMS